MTTPLSTVLEHVRALPQVSGQAQNADVFITFTVYGREGSPLLFLHGFPDEPLSWAHQILEFSRDHRVIVPSLRGFPPSSAPSDASRYSIPEVAGDVVAILDVLNIERATLVGNDWGGVVLQGVALMYPTRVDGIALLNSPLNRPFGELITRDDHQRDLSSYTLPFLESKPGEKPDVGPLLRAIRDDFWRQRITGYLAANSLDGMLSYYKANYPAPPYSPLDPADRPQLVSNLPALIIYGKDDPFFSIKHLSDVWVWFADFVRISFIPGAGHWVHQDEPHLVNAELRSWLKSLEVLRSNTSLAM